MSMNAVMRMKRSLLAAAVGCVLATSTPLFAQTQPAPTAPAEAPKWPDFNAVVKEMIPMPGLMTLYRYKPDDASKDHTKIFCQIPKGLLKQDLLLATTIS